MTKEEFNNLIDKGKFSSALSAVKNSTSEDLEALITLATIYGDSGLPLETYQKKLALFAVDKVKSSTTLTSELPSSEPTNTDTTNTDTTGGV